MNNQANKEIECIDKGEGLNIIVLHGLFGIISQWLPLVESLKSNYRVLVPLLPIYKSSKYKKSVFGLSDFVVDFMTSKNIKECILIGNSLGGHVALLLALKYPKKIKALLLSGSSGLTKPSNEENKIFFKRNNKQFVKEKIEFTFYDPKVVDGNFIDDVYKIINNTIQALRVLRFGKSGTNHNMGPKLKYIKQPTLLIWGREDKITPSRIAYQFNKLLVNSELVFINECGHAPMIEKPEEFNSLVAKFLVSQTI